jgi:hypothetical protein
MTFVYYEAASRMILASCFFMGPRCLIYPILSYPILDSILLALAEISSTRHWQKSVATFPKLRIAQGDGVQTSHPVSGHHYELWLSGSVDYAINEYEDVMDNRTKLNHQNCYLRNDLTASPSAILSVSALAHSGLRMVSCS